MVDIRGCKIKLSNSRSKSEGSLFGDKILVFNVGSQILFSLLLCGLIEVWLSEYTEKHIMQYTWLREEEYSKRQLHVALALISVLCMMSASRISAATHIHYCTAEYPLRSSSEMESSTSIEDDKLQQCKAIAAEISMTMLQGTLSSILSPLVVFLVYVTAIGANTVLGFQYKLHEHLTVEAISHLIFISLQATAATILSLCIPLNMLAYGLRAVDLDPDILVVPLAGAAGHLTYLLFFVKAQGAYGCAAVFLLTLEVIAFFCYFLTKSSSAVLPWGDLVPALATTGVLSIEFATINSAVYEKYPKVDLMFSLTGFLGVMHASHVSTKLQVETARCTPYTFPELSFFGGDHELLRVLLSMAVTPFTAPLLYVHSGLSDTSASHMDICFCLAFCLIWLPIILSVARWSNHFIRHYCGKSVRAGCPTIALLELMQRLIQSIIYIYIMGVIEYVL